MENPEKIPNQPEQPDQQSGIEKKPEKLSLTPKMKTELETLTEKLIKEDMGKLINRFDEENNRGYTITSLLKIVADSHLPKKAISDEIRNIIRFRKDELKKEHKHQGRRDIISSRIKALEKLKKYFEKEEEIKK